MLCTSLFQLGKKYIYNSHFFHFFILHTVRWEKVNVTKNWVGRRGQRSRTGVQGTKQNAAADYFDSSGGSEQARLGRVALQTLENIMMEIKK